VRLALFCRPHQVPGRDLASCLEVAKAADEAGLHGFLFGDHLLMTARTDRYPYGEYQHALDVPWLEPLTTLAAVAAVTTRLRLSTGVLLAPLRSPLVLAKTIATLDVLSHGRVELGIGTGWQREEYEAVGLVWGERNARLDEAVRACRVLWGEQPVDFSSAGTSFDEAWTLPRPVQERVPLLFGMAMTEANAHRVAELGDGWMPVGVERVELAAGAARLRAAFATAGRDPATVIVQLSVGAMLDGAGRLDRTATAAAARPMFEAGATVVSIVLPAGLPSMDHALQFVHDLGDCAGD
jgi:probable F420-dependent oxidoreductase